MELLIFTLLGIVIIVTGAAYLHWSEQWINAAIDDEEQRSPGMLDDEQLL